MNTIRFLTPSRIRRWLVPLCAATVALGLTRSVRADLIVIGQNVTANAGSIGNTLEVDLENTGSSPVTIGTFAFSISTITSNIDFTSATSNTSAPYLFAGDSGDFLLLGLTTINSTSGQSLLASDFSFSGLGDAVDAGATVGLGEVFFDVAAGTAAGPYTVTFDSIATSLSDPAGNNIPISALDNGTITVTPSGSAVPEPSTLLLFSTGLTLLAARTMGRRRWQFDAT